MFLLLAVDFDQVNVSGLRHRGAIISRFSLGEIIGNYCNPVSCDVYCNPVSCDVSYRNVIYLTRISSFDVINFMSQSPNSINSLI